MLTCVQKGSGDHRPLVIGYFIDPIGTPDFLPALGPEACVIVDNADTAGRFVRPPGKGGVDTIDDALSFAHLKAGEFTGPIVLVGWSAGCEAVREQLRLFPMRVNAVIALDGIAGSWPGPLASQMAPWFGIAAQAAHDFALFVVSHTQQTYVEQLKAPNTPFASTVTTAKQLCAAHGLTPPNPGEEASIASFHVISSPSATIDAAAHVHQVRVVLPDITRRLLVPWLNNPGPAVPATDPAPAPEVSS